MKRQGFTFIELLVVVTIFSILSLAIYATFASGMRMWGEIQKTTLSQRVALLRLEKLTQDLRQLLNFYKQIDDERFEIGFSGSESEVAFAGLTANDDIVKITYFLIEEIDTKTFTLWRRQQSFKDILEAKEELPEAKKLLSNIKELKFRFAKDIDPLTGRFIFKDEWKKEEGMPILVKIELKSEEYDFVKTVAIPVS